MRDPTPVITSKKTTDNLSAVNQKEILNSFPFINGTETQLNKSAIIGIPELKEARKSRTEKINGKTTTLVAIVQMIPTLAERKTKAFINAPNKGNKTIKTNKVC